MNGNLNSKNKPKKNQYVLDNAKVMKSLGRLLYQLKLFYKEKNNDIYVPAD